MHKKSLQLVAVVSALLAPGLATAQTLWTGPSEGEWETVSNWDQGVPELNKGANIVTSKPTQIRVKSPAKVQGIQKGGLADTVLTGATLTLGGGYAGTFNSILVNSGNVTIENDLINTQNKRITLNIDGKSLTLNGNLDTGDQTTQIGNLGTGTLTFNGNRSGGNSLLIRDGEVLVNGILSNSGGGNTRVLENGVIISSRAGGPTIQAGSVGLVLLPTGIFRFAAPNQIGGFVNFSGGTMDLAGFSNDKYLIGNASLTADSVIDFRNPANEALAIADVSRNTEWKEGATLRIVGFSGGDSLRFGDNADALTKAQLGSIKFDGKPAQIDSQGYVTPSP